MAKPVYGTVSADVSSVPTNQKGKKKNVMIHMQRLDAPNYDQPVDPVLQHNQTKSINSAKKAWASRAYVQFQNRNEGMVKRLR